MNRPQKIKKVYRELRMELGDEFPAHELLESAALLIGIIEADGLITADQMEDFWVPIKEIAVDEAISDDGWNILTHESWWDQMLDEDDVLTAQERAQLNDYGVGVAA